MTRCLLLALLPLCGTALQAAEPEYRDPPLTDTQRQHWSFRPLARPALPSIRDAKWARTPIDTFILAKLEAAGLQPSPEADRLTWLRRVTFDLTGLPPTPQEIEEFENSALRTPHSALEQVVDRLLDSPHYGERWAQHWLDVVRFAETNGYEADGERPHAWRYRDYVVRAFNSDKPYDRFIREQVAGDSLALKQVKIAAGPLPVPIVLPAAYDLLIATGMHRCGPMHFVGGNHDPEVVRQEILTEMVNGLGSAVLGLTVGCARCHDHKFDPISQGDYYRLQAFFAPTQLKERDLATAAEKAEYQQKVAAIKAKTDPLNAKVAALEAPYRAKLTEMKKAALEPKYRAALAAPAEKRTAQQKQLAEHAALLIKVTWDEVLAALTPADRAKRRLWRDEIHELEAHLPPPPAQAWAVADDPKTPPTYVLKRGETKSKSTIVGPGVVRVLAQDHGDKRRGARNRFDLANWLTDPKNPLTARVWVNRVWQHHFGHGLVATPNDFGARGQPPTHPELLDWLADEFIRHGWSTKELHRLIVLSATYRQCSSSAERGARSAEPHLVPRSALRAPRSVDPDNKLLWRMNRQRLDAETLRDALLAAAGTLNPAVGGPHVLVPLEPEVYDLIFTEAEPDGLWPTTPDQRQHTRRSLYLFAKRNVRQPLLEAFDQPDTLNPCPVRPVSTFTPQALILMNGPLAQQQSKAFAVRLLREVKPEPEALVERAYRLTLARPPRPDEAKLAAQFLRDQTELLRARLLARRPVNTPQNLPPNVDPALAAALADFGLAMFNLNEFIYVD